MRRLNVIFAGTPAFAVPSLEALCEHPAVAVCAVYTQPDRPAGRGQALRQSEIKVAAQKRGVAIEQPPTMRDPAAIAHFIAHGCDLLVVAAYGQILPLAVLEAPSLGAINVHASLLPRWRGAAPIQRALMAGDDSTGITIMRVAERLDAGPMLLQVPTPIHAADTGGSLHDRLADIGGHALCRAIDGLIAGTLRGIAQDESLATYARKVEHGDRIIDWAQDAYQIERQVRALHPVPLAIATLGSLTLNVLAAQVVCDERDAPPGSLLDARDDGLLVRCGHGALRLTSVQPQGRRAMTAREFLNGYRKQLPP